MADKTPAERVRRIENTVGELKSSEKVRERSEADLNSRILSIESDVESIRTDVDDLQDKLERL